MPLYEYICSNCSHSFEALVRGSGAPRCPDCAGQDLRRKLSSFAVGSGGPSPSRAPASFGGCGSCGDPRGPGACALPDN